MSSRLLQRFKLSNLASVVLKLIVQMYVQFYIIL